MIHGCFLIHPFFVFILLAFAAGVGLWLDLGVGERKIDKISYFVLLFGVMIIYSCSQFIEWV